MDKNEFVKLYLDSEDEVKEIIFRILTEDLLLLEPPEMPLNTVYTDK